MCLGIALGKQKIHFENTKFKFVFDKKEKKYGLQTKFIFKTCFLQKA